MKSYALRTINKFHIDSMIEITRTENSTNVIGKIEPYVKSRVIETQIISGKKYEVYKCEFYKEKQMEIIADGIPYHEFKEVNSFYLYVSKAEKLLIADIGLSVSTPFLKFLMSSKPALVDLAYIEFDFKKIVRNNALVDQVWFGTADVHARTKGFNGIEVNRNLEAMKAIEDGKATYLKASIDVASNGRNAKRIIGFSKRSGIVIVKTNDASIDTKEKELNLLIDSYKTYKSFR